MRWGLSAGGRRQWRWRVTRPRLRPQPRQPWRPGRELTPSKASYAPSCPLKSPAIQRSSHTIAFVTLFMEHYLKTSNPFVFYFNWTIPKPNESTSQADSKNGWDVKNQAPVPEIRRLGSCSDALLGKMIQRARAYQLKLAHWNAFEFYTI